MSNLQQFSRNTVLVVMSVASMGLSAHIFPISYGTLTLTPGLVRLRIRISVHNLHPALEAFTGGHLEMKDAGYEVGLLEAYFKGRLELVSPKGKVMPFKIVNQEIGIEEIVFTLEASLQASKGWRLRNAVLFEQSRRQKNYITLEAEGQRLGCTFDMQHPLLPLSAP